MKKYHFFNNANLLIIYYFLFYSPFIFNYVHLLKNQKIIVLFFITLYLVIPLLLWYKFLFSYKENNYLKLLIITILLAFPISSAFRLGIFFMAHQDFTIKVFINTIPFGLFFSVLFGVFSLLIRYFHNLIKES